MKQVLAEVVSEPRQVLGRLERRREVRSVAGSWIIWLKCLDIAREARPGQFVMVRCGEEHPLPRPFSIHRVKQGDIALFFAVWEDGEGTRWLSRRRKGDTVQMFGPLGKGFSIDSTSRNLLLLAGGTGIAPLCFLAEQVCQQGYSVRLLRGASGEFDRSGKPNPPQHYPAELLPRGIEVESIATCRYGKTGMVLDLITAEILNWADQVFACGPSAMCRDVMALSERFPKLRRAQVSLEMRMGCGRGICYGCTVRTKKGLKQVCRDGPVFRLDEIVWNDPVFRV